jgi:hypothetical protein
MLVFILALLFLLGMFYIKRRLDYNDKRLDLLTDTIQTMAGIRMDEINKEDDSDSEDESEESDEEDEDKEDINEIYVRTEDPEIYVSTIEPEIYVRTEEPEIKMIQLPKTTVSDDDVTEFDGFSLKELKEKVTELDGPKLKTKKECIDFLKIKSKKEI